MSKRGIPDQERPFIFGHTMPCGVDLIRLSQRVMRRLHSTDRGWKGR